MRDSYHALIDNAAVLRGAPPSLVARFLRTHLPHRPTVVYWDHRDTLCTAGELGGAAPLFFYYDQAHCIGTDALALQPTRMRALLTCDRHSSLTPTLQAMHRLRLLGRSHSLDFLVDDSLPHVRTAADLYLVLQERDAEIAHRGLLPFTIQYLRAQQHRLMARSDYDHRDYYTKPQLYNALLGPLGQVVEWLQRAQERPAPQDSLFVHHWDDVLRGWAALQEVAAATAATAAGESKQELEQEQELCLDTQQEQDKEKQAQRQVQLRDHLLQQQYPWPTAPLNQWLATVQDGAVQRAAAVETLQVSPLTQWMLARKCDLSAGFQTYNPFAVVETARGPGGSRPVVLMTWTEYGQLAEGSASAVRLLSWTEYPPAYQQLLADNGQVEGPLARQWVAARFPRPFRV